MIYDVVYGYTCCHANIGSITEDNGRTYAYPRGRLRLPMASLSVRPSFWR